MKFKVNIKPDKKKIFNVLKNKYFIASFVFVVWVSFLDQNNKIYTSKVRKELRELKAYKNYYLKEIEETKKVKSDLLNNKETLEEFARENYYMHKADEEVIVVEFED
jgi:cell division protein DivIC